MDPGTEYCGTVERHEYRHFLAAADIEHTRTKAESPQTNGVCERFHKTELDELYQVVFRKQIYRALDALQQDLDTRLEEYNHRRPYQGKRCDGNTLDATRSGGKGIANEKMIAV